MYCERCNIDFPEGLRYCKWCGQTLGERRRVTSELYTCPACSSQVRQGWVFCKSCGSRLEAEGGPKLAEISCPRCGTKSPSSAARCNRCGEDLTEPVAPAAEPAAEASQPGACWSCGEALEPNSLYCKSCGSAVYAGPRISDERQVFCAVCKSPSPVGSFNCRVCGEPLPTTPSVGLETKVHVVPTDSAEQPSTLPDLGEHLAELRRVQSQDVLPTVQVPQVPVPEVNSGAHTFILSTTEGQGVPDQTVTTDDLVSTSGPHKAVEPSSEPTPARESLETNVLSGVADSQTEQTAPTSTLKQTRITAPVEGETTTQMERDEIDEASSRVADEASRAASPPLDKPASPQLYKSASPPVETRVVRDPTLPISSAPTVPSPPETRVSPGPPAPAPVVPERPARESRPAQPRQRPPAPPAKPAVAAQPRRPGVAPQKRSVSAIISVAVALLVLGTGGYVVWWYIAGKSRPEPPPATVPAQVAPTQTPPPVETPKPPAVPPGMVAVAAGSYTIGRNSGDVNDQPAHSVQVGAFFIDRTEVTNSDYKKFIDATSHPAPVSWKGGTYPAGEDKLPVTMVTWQDASDYAEWAGKRLPTESEWESAARGPDGRLYPWGNQWRAGITNIGLKPGKIEEVGRFPEGASPCGAQDMIGNVWEWTGDIMSKYPGSQAKIEQEPNVTYRVIRGGAFDGDKSHDAAYRGYLDASKPWPKVGFRCVKDAK